MEGLASQQCLLSLGCRGMHAQLSALRRLVQLLDPPLYSHLEVGGRGGGERDPAS